MLIHLFNLIGRSFAAIPATLGSTWIGLLFTIITLLIGEAIGLLLFGWQRMIENWKKATGIGFAAIAIGYTLVFAWCAFKTTYEDHKYLAARVATLHTTVTVLSERQAKAVIEAGLPLMQEIATLKQNCAEIRGANGALERQNKDQQGTINNCQNQAIHMLAPVPFKLTVLPMTPSVVALSPGSKRSSWILVTNISMPEAKVGADCNYDLDPTSGAFMVGNTSIGLSGPSTYGRSFRTSIFSPQWTPDRPIQVNLDYKGSGALNCTFLQQ